MAVKLSYRRFDTQAEMNTAPNIWIADNISIPATEWTLVPTAKAVKRARRPFEDIMDEYRQWHLFHAWNIEGEFERGSDTRLLDDVVPQEKLEIVSGGMQGFLCFFPVDGQTVWLKSRGEYETNISYEGELELVKDQNGLIILPPDGVPDATDPFRFIGSADRTQPFIVGPFTRNGSVWIYSTAEINVCWAVFPGRSTGLSIVSG
jgi:hypothetical protein